jgi:hypothetical protein
MKTKHNTFIRFWRKVFQRSRLKHDPLLSLNMSLFNYTDGWSRTFAKEEYGRGWA